MALNQPVKCLAKNGRKDEIDERLAELVATRRTFEEADQVSSPKIQRVPAILRQNPNFYRHCSPRAISFGPIHHRSENLIIGRRYKNLWTSQYIEEYSGQNSKCPSEASKFLHDRIQGNIGELKKLFSDDVLEGYDDRELTWMLFVDGCSLLYFMDKVDMRRPEALKLKLDQLMYTWRDILLLENQLPMKLLELLSKNEGADVEFLVANFRTMGLTKQARETTIRIFQDKPKPTHTILDSYRSVVVDTENRADDRNKKDGDECGQSITPLECGSQFWRRYKNIRDLKKAGIRVKANETDEFNLNNITFISRWFGGELRLPKVPMYMHSRRLFANIIAYEMCPDFSNNFEYCSYLSFMDSLIDDAEDVKELRLAGVFQNLLGSDEEFAKLINETGDVLPTKLFNYLKSDAVACSQKYIQVKLQIHNHYKSKWKLWFAQARDTYFKTPWSFIAFLAAFLALILTFIQSLFSIHSL